MGGGYDVVLPLHLKLTSEEKAASVFINLRLGKTFFDNHKAELAYRRDTSFSGAPSDKLAEIAGIRW